MSYPRRVGDLQRALHDAGRRWTSWLSTAVRRRSISESCGASGCFCLSSTEGQVLPFLSICPSFAICRASTAGFEVSSTRTIRLAMSFPCWPAKNKKNRCCHSQRLAIDPIYGEEAQVIIQRLYRSPADVVERTRKIVQFAEP